MTEDHSLALSIQNTQPTVRKAGPRLDIQSFQGRPSFDEDVKEEGEARNFQSIQDRRYVQSGQNSSTHYVLIGVENERRRRKRPPKPYSTAQQCQEGSFSEILIPNLSVYVNQMTTEK